MCGSTSIALRGCCDGGGINGTKFREAGQRQMNIKSPRLSALMEGNRRLEYSERVQKDLRRVINIFRGLLMLPV